MILESISGLVALCRDAEKRMIEKMVMSAADYVQAVIEMKTTSFNYTARAGEDLRDHVERTDKKRRSAHDALISYVDIVNRLCVAHDYPPIYTSGEARREYGDFAIRLVNEIFEMR